MKAFILDPSDLLVAPLERADTIPASWYLAPEMLDLEKEHVFTKTWQLVGRLEQVREAGEHIIAQIGDEPIVVVRGKDMVLRAFYNVCRHRGGPLAIEDGCASVLQCKYHGWTYALDGSLRGVPDFDRVELFDKSDFGLHPIRVAEWQGHVFINLANDALSLNAMTEGISEMIAPIELSKLQFVLRHDYLVKSNWKVYVDNYLEGYHVPLVHPELFKMYDFRSYKTEIAKWYSHQHSPLKPGENIYSADGGSAFYFFIYPNLMLNILPGRLQTNLVLPIDANTTRIIFDYYYAEGVTEELVREDLRFSDEVQQEDIEICELVQRGLRSRSYHTGRFSVEREIAVHHFQSLLKGSLRSTAEAR